MGKGRSMNQSTLCEVWTPMTAADRDAFERDGYLVVRGVVGCQ
jgi:hypothetical protein